MSYGATPSTMGGQPGPSDESKAMMQESPTRICDVSDLPVLVMPWFLFALAMVPIALLTENLLGTIALVTTLVLSLGFICLSKGRAWAFVAFVCLLMALMGAGVGRYCHSKYIAQFALYVKSPSYNNILPSEDPGAFKDGAFLTFSKDTSVDTTRGLGYKNGQLWCVAPITAGPLDTVGFWAVGTDCCRPRGFFSCGDMSNATLHSGLAILDNSHMSSEDLQNYMQAARMASETYALGLPDDPTFVRWGVVPEDVLESNMGGAMLLMLFALLAALLVVPCLVVVLNLADLRLTKNEPGIVQQMTFGFEWTPREYDKQIQLDLLNHRSYWSGEVIHDYAFHIANKHLFLGPLFCHPAHPFEKWERVVVLFVTVLLLIFPVSAFSAQFGQGGALRTIFVAVFATIPRNLLKLYLIDVSQEDAQLELEEANDARTQDKVRKAEKYEYFLLTAASVVAVVTAVLCSSFIKSHSEDPLGTVLRRNCDGLGFAFILEMVFDLVMPFFGDAEYAQQMTLGFFGRWRWERDDFLGSEALRQGKIPPEQRSMPMKTLPPLSQGGAGALLGRQPQ